jgi:hypothetical protein
LILAADPSRCRSRCSEEERRGEERDVGREVEWKMVRRRQERYLNAMSLQKNSSAGSHSSYEAERIYPGRSPSYSSMG